MYIYIQTQQSLLKYTNIKSNKRSEIMSYQSQAENELQIHQNLYAMITRDKTNSNRKGLIREDCWLIMNRIKIMVNQYLEENSIMEVNLDVLYHYVNQHFFSLKHYYRVLNTEGFLAYPNFFQIVILPIVLYYVRQKNAISGTEIIQNINSQNSEFFSQCLCDQEFNNAQNWISHNRFCYRCGQLYHSVCFQSRESKLYQCPFCFLRFCLPDRQVKQTLFKGYLSPVEQHKQKMSIISNQWQLTDFCYDGISIQLRCVRIGPDNNYEIVWPETCDIFLDNIMSISYKPLSQHSPLKRRHDNPIIIPIRDLVCSQKIKICQYYSGVSAWHLVAVFVVVERNQNQIFNAIINDPYYEMSEEESNEYLQKLFWRSNSVEMEKINISNQCQYYGEKILYPCRSRHCVTHYQPFDLYSFISSSVQAKSSIKRWKCPICRVRAYDIVRDAKLMKNLNQAENKKQLEYYCNQWYEQKQGSNWEEMRKYKQTY